MLSTDKPQAGCVAVQTGIAALITLFEVVSMFDKQNHIRV